MPFMSLDGVRLWVNPDDIRWNFKMKVVDHKTMGGKVIQVLGTTLSDLTISGAFGRGDRAKGETEAWESEIRFRRQVEKWADRAVHTDNTDPMRFIYPPQKWDFQVFIRSVSGTDWSVENINPRWQLVLFPVDDRAQRVVKGIKDLYLKRLLEGVGWKQTEYNGPTQMEVEEELSGRSVEEYIAGRAGEAFDQGTQGQPFSAGPGS